MSSGIIADQLNLQQRALLECAAKNSVDSGEFAGCAGRAMFGDRVSPEARAAIDCAVKSRGDLQGFGGCAANKFLHLNLNPEQQIALQCVVSSGGQPYVAAGCAASRLTARELSKCFENGIGGDSGCFGNNNDLVGRNGFVVRNIAGLAGGPNSVVRDPGQVLGGPNSVFNNPKQLLGGPNSVSNQLLRNVPSPPRSRSVRSAIIEFVFPGAKVFSWQDLKTRRANSTHWIVMLIADFPVRLNSFACPEAIAVETSRRNRTNSRRTNRYRCAGSRWVFHWR